MKTQLSIYNFPEISNLILKRKTGVVEQETQTILKILMDFQINRGKILELGCGTMPHGRKMAAEGFFVMGIDLKKEMLQEAHALAEDENIRIETAEANIIEFSLSETGFDAAVFMFETFPLISRLKDIFSHFASLKTHIKSGGIYIVDIDTSNSAVVKDVEEWGRTNLKIPGGEVDYWYEDHPGDLQDGTAHMVLHTRIQQHGQEIKTRDDWFVRLHSRFTLELLGRALPDWEFVECRNWQDGSRNIGGEQHWFGIFQRI